MSTTLNNRITKIRDYYIGNDAGTFYWNKGNNVTFGGKAGETAYTGIGTTHSPTSITESNYYGSSSCHAFAQYVLSIATGHYLEVATNDYNEPSGPWKLYGKGEITDLKEGDLVRINSGDNGTYWGTDEEGKPKELGNFEHSAIITAFDGDKVMLLQTKNPNCEIVDHTFDSGRKYVLDVDKNGVYDDNEKNDRVAIVTKADIMDYVTYIVRFDDTEASIKEKTITLKNGDNILGTITEVEDSLFFNLPDINEVVDTTYAEEAKWVDENKEEVKNGSAIKTSTVTAQLTMKEVTVTYDYNNGSGTKVNKVATIGSVTADGSVVPENGSLIFDGWRIDGEGDVYKGGMTIPGVTEDIVLKACWKCTVKFELGGGSPSFDDITVYVGEKINIPETVPALEGYHFKGWENSVTRDTVYPGTENVEITQNTDLTARWEEMSVVLRCDTGIATEEISVSFFETENGKIPAPNLTLPGGVTCTKWVIKGGDGTEYDAAAGDLLPEFKNYALIGVDPVYTTYPVTYNLDITDGSGDSSNASVATFEEKVSGEPYYIQKAIPYRNNGLNFLYWQDEAGTLYAPGDRVDTNVPLNLTAQWISGCFVVHFDNGVYEEDTYPVHSVPLAEMYPVLHNEDGSLKEDAGITLPSEVPVRPGYRFLGWRSIFWLSEELYQPGENYVLPNDIYEGFDIRVTNLVPLVAEWEPAYVTVNIHDPYNGSNILGSYTARVGERYGNSYVNGSVAEIEFPVIADRGETVHVGWCYGVEEVTEDSTVTADTEHTLNPIWYEETEYTDIANQSSEAKNAIAWCKYKGYMTGTSATVFTPGGSMSRGQAAMTLYKCVGQPAWGSNSFMDVHEDDYYNVAVSWCNDNGIMSGRSANYFRPSDPITRAEFVTALYRFCGLLAPGKQTVDCDLSDSCLCSSYAEGQCKLARFEDISELSEWGRLPMAWAVNNGIMSGVSDIKLSPNVSLTRAQCAIILRRFFSYTDA